MPVHARMGMRALRTGMRALRTGMRALRTGMQALRTGMRALRGLETGSYKVTLRPASVIARRPHALSGAATA